MLLRSLKRLAKAVRDFPRKRRLADLIQMRGDAASGEIARLIASGKPFFVGRFGSTEIDALVQFEKVLAGAAWKEETFRKLKLDSGVFPVKRDVIANFHAMYLEAMAQLDVLGSWCLDELHFAKRLVRTTRVPLADLEPYYHSNPWSAALAGKKVLVVHPFVRTIEAQYQAHRAELFPNPETLPPFTLLTIQGIQCHDGNAEYPSWIDAYEEVKAKVDATDFDIAIIGWGAFGFPLAAHIKSIGKQAIHLGGATQILFGVIGKRWESIPEISRFFNAAWRRPMESEMPKNATKVENGAYW